jgi:hypothetical protein
MMVNGFGRAETSRCVMTIGCAEWPVQGTGINAAMLAARWIARTSRAMTGGEGPEFS